MSEANLLFHGWQTAQLSILLRERADFVASLQIVQCWRPTTESFAKCNQHHLAGRNSTLLVPQNSCDDE